MRLIVNALLFAFVPFAENCKPYNVRMKTSAHEKLEEKGVC